MKTITIIIIFIIIIFITIIKLVIPVDPADRFRKSSTYCRRLSLIIRILFGIFEHLKNKWAPFFFSYKKYSDNGLLHGFKKLPV